MKLTSGRYEALSYGTVCTSKPAGDKVGSMRTRYLGCASSLRPRPLPQTPQPRSRLPQILAIMTFTVLLVLYRKPSLAPAAFRAHYETRHLPLLRELAGPTFPLRHVRHYVARDEDRAPDYPATALIGAPSDFAYDALTELVFADAAAFAEFSTTTGTPEARARLAEDEAEFMAEGTMRAVVVGETVVAEKE